MVLKVKMSQKSTNSIQSTFLSDELTSKIDAYTDSSITNPDWSLNKSREKLAATVLVSMAIASPSNCQVYTDRVRRKDLENTKSLGELERNHELADLSDKLLYVILRNNENFEDGEISDMAKSAIRLYAQNPSIAPEALARAFKYVRHQESDKIGEIVKWLGYMSASKADTSLVWVLLNCARSGSNYIRDAAALALVEYADLISSDLIRRAYNNEDVDYIKDTLLYALKRSEDAETH